MKRTKDIGAATVGRAHPEAEFIGAFMVLVFIGFVAMWTSSSAYALRIDKGASYFAQRQALFIVIALIVFVIAYFFPLDKLRGRMGLVTFLSFLILLTPFVPGLGVEINGARRWIDLRITNFQPSELWKPVSVLYAAHVLDRRGEMIRKSAGEAVFPFVVIGLGVLVTFLQDDFSTSMLALFAPLFVFWLAGTPIKFFLGASLLAVPSIILMVTSSEYRLSRVLGFIVPEFDPHGMNYQIQNSVRAIMSGGLWGKGLGLGTRKLGSIPEIQSDFVFAGFVEEMGFFGVVAVFACWIFLVYSVLKALRGRRGFPYLLSLGLVCLMSLEFLTNLGVVSGFLPVTGIALPFFSSGGSSLFATAFAGGLIANTLKGGDSIPVADPATYTTLAGGGNGRSSIAR
ncbi:MAG: FtsW/RodA/SpoVE family cell cycle protein [Spirochaetes bacterium]|nr:FtsW/RodA/SpoVE family cell cycle protein [Spirochaetota bacterium]